MRGREGERKGKEEGKEILRAKRREKERKKKKALQRSFFTRHLVSSLSEGTSGLNCVPGALLMFTRLSLRAESDEEASTVGWNA